MGNLRKRLVIAALFALGACKDGDVADPGNPTITINVAQDSLLLNVGQTGLLTVQVSGSTQKPSYTSMNSAVASVDTAGIVLARTPGSTYVVAALGGARDSSKIIVQGNACLVSSATSVVTSAATTAGALSLVGPDAVSANSFASPPVLLPLLGSGIARERFTGEVTASGTTAYTTTWSSRNGVPGNALKIWNASGNTPILADSIIVQGAGTLSDVQISDDAKLLVVSIERSNPASVNGISIYDRRNATKPSLIRHFSCASTLGGVHTVKLGRIAGRLYAFMAVNSPAQLVVADITDPMSPTEVLVRPMGNPVLHDVFIRDGILFTALWNDGLKIWDVGGAGRGGTPANPVALGSVKTAPCPGCGIGTSSVHNVWWFHDPQTGSKKYAFVGEEGAATLFTRAQGDIHVVDVSNFDQPREVAFFRPDSATTSTGMQPAGTHNFDVDEPSGILYAAYYNGGVRALDIRGDLSSCQPTEKATDGRCNLRLMGREVGVALTSAPSFVWGVKIVGSVLYASDMPNGIHKIDISALKR